MSAVICHWFPQVVKSQVKIIGKSHHKLTKIIIHGNKCIILFVACYFMSCAHNSAKNNHPDLALWRHHSWSVTSTWGIVLSYSSIVLAQANWCKLDLHYWITIMNINPSPPRIHRLVFKYAYYIMVKYQIILQIAWHDPLKQANTVCSTHFVRGKLYCYVSILCFLTVIH